jgi:hypothetical protein
VVGVDHVALLETEYKEQYDQYRWIGTMQSVVLTFYGAVASFGLLAANALRPQPPASLDTRWIAAILIGDGLLGVLTGIALLRSRSMQRRTAWYLFSLLEQMTHAIDSWIIEKSALRYRELCVSGTSFSLLDTMNTAFLIALLSGEAFLISGVAVFIATQWQFPVFWPLTIGVATYFVFVPATLLLVCWRARAETRQMQCEYLKAERAIGLLGVRSKMGLPQG